MPIPDEQIPLLDIRHDFEWIIYKPYEMGIRDHDMLDYSIDELWSWDERTARRTSRTLNALYKMPLGIVTTIGHLQIVKVLKERKTHE